MKNIKIALVGNTNAGKTTLLNTLCGLNQETSNYPGTTVELFKAETKYEEIEYEITDLPGTYSLTPFSEEEKVTREILQKNEFDLVVQVIESKFKKRSLAFTLELMEMELPLMIVVNNKDNVWHKADFFLQNIKKHLGISGINLNAFEKKAKELFFYEITKNKSQIINYEKILNEVHNSLQNEIVKIKKEFKINNLWIILKFLENDQEIITKFQATDKLASLLKEADTDKNYSLEIKNNRFHFIEFHLSKYLGFGGRQGKCGNGAHRFQNQENCNCSFFNTDKIDALLLNKWLGIPIFLCLMWFIFQTTFTLGAIPMDWIDGLIGLFQEKLVSVLPQNLLSSVLIDGVIGGVGATLVFLPPIMFLFFFLSILQQSGYLARTAYLLDNLMQKIGLGGKSFVPLLMGFGCSVPAIMATRTLTSRKDRIITSMMVPFMSCGAKLPVYTVFIAAFFEEQWQGTVLFSLYVFGILMSVFSGFFFNKFMKDKKSHLLLELPSYTLPKLKNICRAVWISAREFLYKAGRVILPLAVILWFLFTFPIQNNESVPIEESYAAQIGKTVEPVFEPLGFDWRISTGLIAGLGAKEVFIATFGAMYSLEENDEEGLILQLQNDPIFTPLSVLSLLIFVLIYTPCVAVIGVLKQEFGWNWGFIGLIYPTVLAWILSFSVYQIGSMF
ncbi:MAG: ferrous iron transport protein B [Patescibacteria group bacterium]|nr:ferrous iron transport protein B [Patescibacteria group bacterium]